MRKILKISAFLFLTWLVILLSACSGPDGEEETATITINLGGGTLLNRATTGFPPKDNPVTPGPSTGPNLADLSYVIAISGTPVTETPQEDPATGNYIVSKSVSPGTYDIRVEAYEPISGSPVLYATGKDTVTVSAGETKTVTIIMKQALTVGFHINDGVATAPYLSIQAGLDDKIINPSDPVNTPNTFDGWFREAACTTPWDFGNDPVTSDITLYAKWIPFGAVTITAGTPVHTLIPFGTTDSAYRKSTTFNVTLGGVDVGDTVTVALNTADAAAYGLSLSGNTGLSNGGPASLTLTYDEITTVSSITPNNIRLEITGSPPYSASGTPTVSVTIIDGQDQARQIPVTQNNLAEFSTYSSTYTGLTRNFKLAGNITLPNPWTPIGNDYQQFSGTLDGDGHSIDFGTSNSIPIVGTGAFGVIGGEGGLFGYIGTNGKVKNLKLTGSISFSDSGSGRYYTGAVAGVNIGSISNISSSVEVTSTLTPGTSYTGGITGGNTGTITNCYSTGDITVTSDGSASVGSITGNTGDFNGLGGSITLCWASGAISGTENNTGSGASASGIVGSMENNCAVILTNCVALNNSISASHVGSSAFTGRIVVYDNGYAGTTLSDNYALTGMSITPTRTPTNSATSIDGGNIPSTSENDDTWWTGASGPGWSFAANQGAAAANALAGSGSPWYWGAGNRPRLWFE